MSASVLSDSGPPATAKFQALVARGSQLFQARRYEEALQVFQQALQLDPQPFLHANIGAVYRKLLRHADAEASFLQALQGNPADPVTWYNYANLLYETDRLPEAIASYRKALEHAPQHAGIHWNLAHALLAHGELREGFAEYEWRWRYPHFPGQRRGFKQAQWDGSRLVGKTLLVHTEQGVGDALMFLRFLPAILARRGRGGRVILECHQALLPLLQQVEGLDQIVARSRSQPLPGFDLHLPLMSAGHVLGIERAGQIPVDFPYLQRPKRRVALPEYRRGALNIGFVWAGNPDYQWDMHRSTDLSWFAPLFELPGTRWFSLQKGPREQELAPYPQVVNLAPRLRDYVDTAALICKLDLVISVCTSVVHLALMLDKPTWVLLGHAPDWRWQRGQARSIWYPQCRIFRQTAPMEWEGEFQAVAEAVCAVAGVT